MKLLGIVKQILLGIAVLAAIWIAMLGPLLGIAYLIDRAFPKIPEALAMVLIGVAWFGFMALLVSLPGWFRRK